LQKETISLESRLDLALWEIDPAWDGKTFRSAAQAVRPVRSGEIPNEIKIKTGRNVCIRLVTAKGKRYQLNV